MRAFTEDEKAVIQRLAVWRQGKPGLMEEFLLENVFTAQSPLAVIIQTHRRYAVLYRSSAAEQDTPRESLDRRFFELLALLAYLRGNGYITIYGGSRHEDREALYYLHASFDAPRVEGNTIYLNEAGDFSNHPETILNKSHRIQFRGALLQGDLYELVLSNMTGVVCVSQGLLELLAFRNQEAQRSAARPARPPRWLLRIEWHKVAVALLVCTHAAFSYFGLLAHSTIKNVAASVESLRSQQEQLTKKIPTEQHNSDVVASESAKGEYYGVDVSRWNGDFSREIDRIPKMSFAISKATEGLTIRDEQFQNNRKLLRARGITHGGYHLFRLGDDPVAQTEFYLATMGTIGKEDIAPVVDVEEASLSQRNLPDPATLQSHVLLMLRTLEARTGRSPILYTNLSFAQKYFGSAELAHYRLWLAEYTPGPPQIPDAWRASGYFIWQRSASYKVGSSEIDLDIYRGDKTALVR